MNRTSKIIIILSVLVLGAIGFKLYESRQAEIVEMRIAVLEKELADTKRLKTESAAKPVKTVDTTKPREKLAPSSGSVGDDIHTRVATLKEIMVRLPEQGIPELKLATDSDWYSAVDGKLESEEDFRRALARLRSLAEARFAKALQPALRDYLTANNGRFPANTSELQAYVGPEIDSTMLRRYQVAPASYISNVRMGGDNIITQVSVVDSDYDMLTVIGPRGTGATNATMPLLLKEKEVVLPAIRAYKSATGNGHTEILQVLPYASTPEQQSIIRKWAESEKKGKAL